MSQFQPVRYNLLPEVVKNLIIINGLFYLATVVLDLNFGIDLGRILGMYNIKSTYFAPYQIVTYMFMHGSFMHILGNMFALWMFGSALENVWGPKRFLTFYLVTGFGAAFLHQVIGAAEIMSLQNDIANQIGDITTLKADLLQKLNMPTVGASGSVFGLLAGFGLLFPNSIILIYFLLPLKAKYFVILYGIAEFYLGIQNNPSDNVAHFAHLGGMLFGFILIKIWDKSRNRFY